MELLEFLQSLSLWVRESQLNMVMLGALAALFATSLWLSLREFASWFAHVGRVEKRIHALEEEIHRLRHKVDALSLAKTLPEPKPEVRFQLPKEPTVH